MGLETAGNGISTFPLRVQRIRHEAEGIRSFELVEPEGRPLPPFTPGAHIDVHVTPGIVRQYSLCNGPLDCTAYLIAVRLTGASRGGSRGLHEGIVEGDTLVVGAPRNAFPLERAGHSLLIAGGIGLTPLLSMARHLHHDGRSFALHSFTRSSVHTAFRETLTEPAWGARVHLHEGLDRACREAVLRNVLEAPRAPADHLYLCGPQPFMRQIQDFAAAAGWPPHSVRREDFAPEDGASVGASVEVELRRSGLTFEVPPDRSIADVLLDAGVDLEVSCQQGLCGTCVTPVLEGVPDHRDTFLTAAQRQANCCMALCVSRAKTPRLVLNL